MITTDPSRLRIALQKDGRITEDSRATLRGSGLDLEFQSRVLLSRCRNYPLDVLSVRDDDIPEYVQDGVSDLGIVGYNTVIERDADVEIVERLGFGRCRMAICAPKALRIVSVEQLAGKRIATSYLHTLDQFLEQRRVSAEIVEISGSVEIAPALNIADAIFDLVSTGSTAQQNGLEEVFTVLESEAVLIANPASMKNPQKREKIDQLHFRIRSRMSAKGKKYVMMNAPADQVEHIREFVPGMKSPSIMPLANPGMVAVHSVLAEENLWDVIEHLKRVGATDLIVVPIEKMIP